jgi:hypothetical protein
VKFQKMIRILMMLMAGMGAGLLLARPVYAQQDVDPTFFDYAYNTPVMDQASNATPSAEAAKVAGADSTAPLAAQRENAVALAPVDTSAVKLLMIAIGSTVLLGIAKVVRGSRRRTWREKAPGSFPTGATAN